MNLVIVFYRFLVVLSSILKGQILRLAWYLPIRTHISHVASKVRFCMICDRFGVPIRL